MIANLNIFDHESTGYLVRLNSSPAGLPYASIAQAIADHENIPQVYATYVNIKYQGVRLATVAVDDMRGRARSGG